MTSNIIDYHQARVRIRLRGRVRIRLRARVTEGEE